jgi:hypothetical protein
MSTRILLKLYIAAWGIVVVSVAWTVLAHKAIKPTPPTDADIPEIGSTQPVKSIKGDREPVKQIRVIPISKPPPTLDEDPKLTLAEAPPRAEAPPTLPPVIEIPKPEKPKQESNLCTQHGGWKVETNNGRSWHCEYPP